MHQIKEVSYQMFRTRTTLMNTEYYCYLVITCNVVKFEMKYAAKYFKYRSFKISISILIIRMIPSVKIKNIY